MPQRIRFREIKTNIEEKPGIYEIHTDSGIALKVGIAVNLRKRLLQHRASRQSCLKLKPGGQWDNSNDVRSKGSILAKHLYYDGSITTEYDLLGQSGRQALLDERCYIVFEVTGTKAEARELERERESYGRYRYMKAVHKRLKETETCSVNAVVASQRFWVRSSRGTIKSCARILSVAQAVSWLFARLWRPSRISLLARFSPKL